MIKEEKIEFTSRWCKYSTYKILKRDEKLYILPDKKAIPNTYDPFDYRNEILRDLLMIGKEVYESDITKTNDYALKYEILSKIENFQLLVFNFVSQYGLLGNFRYLPENYDFMDNAKIPVRLGFNETTTANEFEKRYFGFDKSLDWTRKMNATEYCKHSGFDDYFRQTEGDRLNDIIFSKYYSETLAEILNFAERIYSTKIAIYTYLYSDEPNDIKEMYENSITSHNLKKTEICYGIENGKVKFRWKFMSLSAIIETMLLVNETNGRIEVRLCKHCHKPFIAENIKSEYDTVQCRNKENVNRSKSKNKNKNKQ